MPRHPLTVAVTGLNATDNPAPGVAVIRALLADPEFDLTIIGLAYDALDPGIYMNDLCDRVYLIPFPSSGEEELLGRLAAIHAENPIDLLIPTLAAELLSFVHLEAQLAELGIKMLVPTEETLRLRGKDRLPELAAKAGIPAPRTEPIGDPGFFASAVKEGWRYPLVVKGIFYDAKVVHTVEAGIAAFHAIAAQWGLPLLVQEYVAGEEYNLSAVGDGEGRLLGPVMMKKTFLTEKGKGWAGVSILDPAFLVAAEKLVAGLNWRGGLEVEVKRRPDGSLLLLEINPRFPAWIYLSVGVGRNLPALLARLALDLPLPDLTPYKAGTMFVRFSQDMIVDLADFEAVAVTGHLNHDTQGGAP